VEEKGLTEKEAYSLLLKEGSLKPVEMGTEEFDRMVQYVEKVVEQVEKEKLKR
jgi:hypothetical protein